MGDSYVLAIRHVQVVVANKQRPHAEYAVDLVGKLAGDRQDDVLLSPALRTARARIRAAVTASMATTRPRPRPTGGAGRWRLRLGSRRRRLPDRFAARSSQVNDDAISEPPFGAEHEARRRDVRLDVEHDAQHVAG